MLKNPDRYQPKSPAKKEGFPGPITEEKGFVSYAEICQLVSDGTWTKRTDADSNVYVTKGNQWAGYDTPNSVRRKVIFFYVYQGMFQNAKVTSNKICKTSNVIFWHSFIALSLVSRAWSVSFQNQSREAYDLRLDDPSEMSFCGYKFDQSV